MALDAEIQLFACRLNVTQTWLTKEAKSDSYTARLITVSQKRGVFLERFLRHFADFYPLRNVMVYPMRLKTAINLF